MKRILTTSFIAALAALILAPAAGATFPGGTGLIAATSSRDGNEEIYSMDQNGGLVTRLTNEAGRDFDPSFSPDGSRIAFVSNRDGDLEIYLMDADGSNQTRLTNNAGDDMDPAWSPDGNRLAIRRSVSGDNEIFMIDSADGGNAVNLTQNAASDFAPDFSPDGTKIAFQRYTAGSGTGLGNEVMLMNADGSDQTNLTANVNTINDGRPSFSPDGETIAFHSNRDDSGFQIFNLALADSTIDRVVDDAGLSLPVYSPGGEWIAVRQEAGISDQLAVIDTAGATVTPITTATGESSPDWQADDIVPVASIDSGPAAGQHIPTDSPDFGFSASEPGSSFECEIDGAGFSPCVSPLGAGPLDDGAHTFSVRATDIAGNVSEPAARSFTVDTVPPEVVFESGPPPISGETTSEFAFSVNEANLGAECDLDGAPVTPCTTPVTIGSLTDGDHTLKVRATDLAGNVGDYAEYSWTVDTTPSTVTIVSGPDDPTAEPNAWFQFTADDSDATFECRMDPTAQTAWNPCVSGVSYENLTDGNHHFQVRAVEPGAGPGPVAEASWTIDTVAPRLSLNATPASPTNRTDADFGFEMNKPGFTFTCQLDDGPEAPCQSPLALASLPVGDHSLLIIARDGDDEEVDSIAYGWTILAAPPTAAITSGPTPIVAASSSVVKFNADVPEAVFECSFNQGSWEVCTSPAVLTSVADGPASLAVRAKLPGEQPGPAVERQWMVDTRAPSLAITAGPTGRVANTDAEFIITSDDPGAAVTCKVDEGAWQACSDRLSLANLTDGAHVLRVSGTDEAGNTGWVRRDWTVDVSGPSITIKSGPPASTTSRSSRFTFAASEAGAIFECRLDGNAWSRCTSPHEVSFTEPGDHRFEVRATDDLGNVGEVAGRDWAVTVPATRGSKPSLKTFNRTRVNAMGIARIATVGCVEGRCRVTAPHRVTYRLKGRKFTPGIRSPRGFYRERNSEIMLTMSPRARRFLAAHGPARIKLRLKVESDNGQKLVRSLRVTLTAK